MIRSVRLTTGITWENAGSLHRYLFCHNFLITKDDLSSMYKRQRSQSATRGQLSDFSLGKRKLVDLLFFFLRLKENCLVIFLWHWGKTNGNVTGWEQNRFITLLQKQTCRVKLFPQLLALMFIIISVTTEHLEATAFVKDNTDALTTIWSSNVVHSSANFLCIPSFLCHLQTINSAYWLKCL